MDNQNFDKLLDRYLRGETDASENEQVEQWLQEIEPEHTEWKALHDVSRKVWLTNLRNDIHESIKPMGRDRSGPTKLKLWGTIAAAAASIVIVFSVALNWQSIQNSIHPQQFSTLYVPEHQKKRVVLPDGSLVWINASSELKFPKSFEGRTREVFLNGEAYFDIKHDAKKPFIVHTGLLSTTVLGTAFNINANRNTDQIIVTVTRGKVSVSDQTSVLAYIIPNQQMVYNLKEKKEEKLFVDAQKAIAWQGDIYFDDTTFEEATKLLARRFNVEIGFVNETMKGCRFSGTAMGGKSVDEILKVICAINQASYRKDKDGNILISGHGCN